MLSKQSVSLEISVRTMNICWKVSCPSTLEVKDVVHGAFEWDLEITAWNDT